MNRKEEIQFKDKHIRFSSSDSSSDEAVDKNEENLVVKEQTMETEKPQLVKKTQEQQTKQKTRQEPVSKVNRCETRKKKENFERKEFDYSKLEALKGAPRVNERIAFQVAKNIIYIIFYDSLY